MTEPGGDLPGEDRAEEAGDVSEGVADCAGESPGAPSRSTLESWAWPWYAPGAPVLFPFGTAGDGGHDTATSLPAVVPRHSTPEAPAGGACAGGIEVP